MKDIDVITSEQHQQKRQADFNERLEGRQKEFTDMINSNQPPKIDFRDTEEEEETYKRYIGSRSSYG